MFHLKRILTTACVACLFFVQSIAAPVINEIMYRPGSGYPEDTGLEFIEIHNPDSEAIDISGWAITTGAGFEFPSDTILSGGGFAVIASDPTALQAASGIGGVFGPWASGATLANNGETITLSEPDGDGGWNVVDEVDYASEGDGLRARWDTSYDHRAVMAAWPTGVSNPGLVTVPTPGPPRISTWRALP